MTDREILESRIFMTEDALCARADQLGQRLHEVEARLRDVAGYVHRVLCTEPGVPLETKATEIVRVLSELKAVLDPDEIAATCDRVASLRGVLNGYERERADLEQSPDPEVLALAG